MRDWYSNCKWQNKHNKEKIEGPNRWSERKYLVNLNDFKSPGSDELHHKPAERNCGCNLRDTIGNLQEIVETIGVPLTREGQLFPRFLK